MKFCLSLIMIVVGISALSQDKPDPAFLNHLMNREYHKEVVYLIDKANVEKYHGSFRDSLHYLKGWSLYAMKKLTRSAHALDQVGRASPFYYKSRFFSAYNYLHTGNAAKAASTLNNLQINVQNLKTLRTFERAGIALMTRNLDQFDKTFASLDTTYYPVTEESARLNQYATDLRNHRKKSPLLAGIMSSVIPGSGKIYGGKTGEGISSFLTVGGLAFVTWENYRKKGPKNFKTLFFGAAFSAFYIGNIYGTVFSVKIAEDEFQNEYDHKILFNLHIPLRNVFN